MYNLTTTEIVGFKVSIHLTQDEIPLVIKEEDRWRIYRRDHYLCVYCGGKADTLDHVVPESLGGSNHSCNLVACCRRCNGKKSGAADWEAWYERHPKFSVERREYIRNLSPCSGMSTRERMPPIRVVTEGEEYERACNEFEALFAQPIDDSIE